MVGSQILCYLTSELHLKLLVPPPHGRLSSLDIQNITLSWVLSYFTDHYFFSLLCRFLCLALTSQCCSALRDIFLFSFLPPYPFDNPLQTHGFKIIYIEKTQNIYFQPIPLSRIPHWYIPLFMQYPLSGAKNISKLNRLKTDTLISPHHPHHHTEPSQSHLIITTSSPLLRLKSWNHHYSLLFLQKISPNNQKILLILPFLWILNSTSITTNTVSTLSLLTHLNYS